MDNDETNDGAALQASIFRAAEYVRMSTEHQQYSTENQADKIREYAARRGIEIVKTYADAGKSGLSIEGRINVVLGPMDRSEPVKNFGQSGSVTGSLEKALPLRQKYSHPCHPED